jgi:hypothetical protein
MPVVMVETIVLYKLFNTYKVMHKVRILIIKTGNRKLTIGDVNKYKKFVCKEYKMWLLGKG